MTTHEDLALLQQIAELIDDADGDRTDTARLAAASGRATFGPPWFELHDVLSELEREGLVRIEPAPTDLSSSDPAASAGEAIGLRVTDAGRAALVPRSSE